MKANDTVVVVLAYGNAANTGLITVNGLSAHWVNGYGGFQNKQGIAFFYGQDVGGLAKTVTISAPNSDSFAAAAMEWTGLSTLEDPGSQSFSSGIGTSVSSSSSTSNATDVVFNAVVQHGALFSPPQGNFRQALGPNSKSGPQLAPAYSVVGTTGVYNNTLVLSKSESWISVAVAVESSVPYTPPFTSVPLTDFAPGQLYLGKFPGLLYNGSNIMPAQHDSDGRGFGAAVQPLDASGNPSASGKLGVVVIGMSAWTEENCSGASTPTNCDPNTFFDQAKNYPGVNPAMVLVDCAQGNQETQAWMTSTSSAWSTCLSRLSTLYNLTPQQVQVVLWKDADNPPTGHKTLVGLSALTGTTCPSNPNPSVDPDACVYEQNVATVARVVRQQFPNTQQMFLHSRAYGGFVPPGGPRVEPEDYEQAFAVKWLVNAQINQIAGAGIDPLAGDLGYTTVPWLAWGPYFWAPNDVPRSDGLLWLGGFDGWDGIHTSWCRFYGINCGRRQIANMMMGFYPSSPYAPWFTN